jgi:hypothetical protein
VTGAGQHWDAYASGMARGTRNASVWIAVQSRPIVWKKQRALVGEAEVRHASVEPTQSLSRLTFAGLPSMIDRMMVMSLVVA